MDRMPKVTHIIYIPTQRPYQKDQDLPKHVKLLSMDEVENVGAIPDNCRLYTLYYSMCMLKQ